MQGWGGVASWVGRWPQQLPWHPAASPSCNTLCPFPCPPACHRPPIISRIAPLPPPHTCIHSLPRLPQVDATVKSWNVKILGLNRQSRHRDATMAQEFWRMLDTHLQARGSTLAY